MSYTNRIAERTANPTPEQIEEECRKIRAHWSPEIQHSRKINRRVDPAVFRVDANLRFLKFLAEYENADS